MKCAPAEGHSPELCGSQCRPSKEVLGFLAKEELLDSARFCFYECKPPFGAALAAQCLPLKASELKEALDSDGNAMDPAFLYARRDASSTALAAEPVDEADADDGKAKKLALKGRKAVKELKNATEDVKDLWDSDVAKEAHAADPLAAAGRARDAAEEAEDAAVQAQREAERSIEALKTGRNRTWMAAMWQANEALNFMKRNDFRLATAQQQSHTPIAWRFRAAEAARTAAAPYLQAHQHYAETVPSLQRQAALRSSEEAQRLQREAERLSTQASVLRHRGDASRAAIVERSAQALQRRAEAEELTSQEHLDAARASLKKSEDEGFMEHAQVAAEQAVQAVKLPKRYQLALAPDPLRNWAPTAPHPLP